MYIKVFDAEDNYIGVENIKNPCFIRWQTSNDKQVRCEQSEAQGILSADENKIYLINGVMPHGVKKQYAVIIEKSEYDSLASNDPEDEIPDIPENTQPEEILTRAQLSEKVAKLELQNEFLAECLLEISEVIYA